MPAIALLAAACGSPAAPEPPPLPAGSYFLQFAARGLECGRFSDTAVATTIVANVTSVIDGTTWIGRPAGPESGSFEIRITRNGPGTPVRVPVSGTFEGQAEDVGRPPFLLPRGIVARASTRVPLTGETLGAGYMTPVVVNGPLTFVRGQESVTCQAAGAMLAISRNPPAF